MQALRTWLHSLKRVALRETKVREIGEGRVAAGIATMLIIIIIMRIPRAEVDKAKDKVTVASKVGVATVAGIEVMANTGGTNHMGEEGVTEVTIIIIITEVEVKAKWLAKIAA